MNNNAETDRIILKRKEDKMESMRDVKLSMFTPKDLQRVHDYSLKLLWENGINIANDRALNLFKKHGFKVEGSQIFMTQKQVEYALENTPTHFVFHGRNSDRSLDLGGGDYGVCSPIGPVNIRTVDEGIRPGSLKDVENLVKLYQASSIININTNNGVEANDVPTENRHLEIMRVVLRHTDKPVYTRLFDYEQMHEAMDMVEIAVGEKLEKGGNIWFAPGSCPSLSPMAYSREVADCIIALAERGQAVTLGSATSTGVTGPIQIFGTIVMQNAEQLAGIVLTQLVHPGNAVGYGVAACPGNMQGAKYCCGSPGRVALQIGSIEMGKRFYNMPTRTEPYTTESSLNDVQSGIESYEGSMANILSGADYQLGEIGTLDSLMTVSYEKTILDEEVTSRLLYIKKGIDVSEEASAVESIKSVGSGGTFLLEDDTIDQMYDAWYPPYTDWNRDADRINEYTYSYIVEKANREWKHRLAESPETMLDTGTEKALDDYVNAHSK